MSRSLLGLRVADVGDGMCATVFLDHAFVQVDCGSAQGAMRAMAGLPWWWRERPYWDGPGALVLSHFHHDHYNGILLAAEHDPPRPVAPIGYVLFPRLPEALPDAPRFVQAQFAMARRLGDRSGLMEYDLVEAVQRISSSRSLTYLPVSSGDTFPFGASRLGRPP